MKLAVIGALSLFLVMLVPVYADITEISIQKDFYTIDEKIVFVGNEDEGSKMVNIVMINPNGKESYLVGAMSNSEGAFQTMPKSVKDVFSAVGTYQFTAFTVQKENGITTDLKYDGNRVLQPTKSILQLNSIGDKIIEVEKTITFTASINDDSITNAVYSLEDAPKDATIDSVTGKFIWTPSKSHGSFKDIDYNFDIIVNAEEQKDRENITIIVKKAYDEPIIKAEPTVVAEPEIKAEPTVMVEESKSTLASFVDETKDLQSYVDRYNNEESYKKWFDDNYSQYSSIYEAVGADENNKKTIAEYVAEPVVEYTPEPITEVTSTPNCGTGTEEVNGICQVIKNNDQLQNNELDNLKKILPDYYNVDKENTMVLSENITILSATINNDEGGKGEVTLTYYSDNDESVWSLFNKYKTGLDNVRDIGDLDETCYIGLPYVQSPEVKSLFCVKDNVLITATTNNGEEISTMKQIFEKMNDSSSNTNNSNGGGCLIATATYGSELAPQVQQLRELRDNQLLNTESGTAFMETFNDIYYSFSPIIADYERENPYFKEAVKLAITPMISTLSLMENAETESEVLGIGISVIMLNLGMYLGIPAIVIVGIRKTVNS